MPYKVESKCDGCGSQHRFVIGLWPEHLGVYMCRACAMPVNIPLETGQCPGCGVQPSVAEFYDYARSIPFYHGESLGRLEPGPTCPNCAEGTLSFTIHCHFNVGRLGAYEGPLPPWAGRDYLEKAIFAYALISICADFDLDMAEVFAYYNMDVPWSLLAQRKISLPIRMDIHNHLLAAVAAGEVKFANMLKLEQCAQEAYAPLLNVLSPRAKKWWQFWR
jgi:hypothetical protein